VERVNEKFIAKPNEGDKKQRATKTKQNIIYVLTGFLAVASDKSTDDQRLPAELSE